MIRPYEIGVKPTIAAVSRCHLHLCKCRCLWDSEAVALAPPCTHAVH